MGRGGSWWEVDLSGASWEDEGLRCGTAGSAFEKREREEAGLGAAADWAIF